MSFGGRLRASLMPIVPEVAPNRYDGDALTYLVYNYTELPRVHAEGRPSVVVYLLQVHLYLPHGVNPDDLKRRIITALFAMGCTWPDVTNASDEDGQHYVFECQGKDPL